MGRGAKKASEVREMIQYIAGAVLGAVVFSAAAAGSFEQSCKNVGHGDLLDAYQYSEYWAGQRSGTAQSALVSLGDIRSAYLMDNKDHLVRALEKFSSAVNQDPQQFERLIFAQEGQNNAALYELQAYSMAADAVPTLENLRRAVAQANLVSDQYNYEGHLARFGQLAMRDGFRTLFPAFGAEHIFAARLKLASGDQDVSTEINALQTLSSQILEELLILTKASSDPKTDSEAIGGGGSIPSSHRELQREFARIEFNIGLLMEFANYSPDEIAPHFSRAVEYFPPDCGQRFRAIARLAELQNQLMAGGEALAINNILLARAWSDAGEISNIQTPTLFKRAKTRLSKIIEMSAPGAMTSLFEPTAKH